MSSDNGQQINGASSPREGGASGQPHFSIDDLNPDMTYDVSIKQLLNSPRTLEACRRQGIDPRELDPVSEKEVRRQIMARDKGNYKRGIPQVLVDIRLKHHETKRRDMIRIIREERYAIMDEAEKGSKFLSKRSNSGGSPQPSLMLRGPAAALNGGHSQHSPIGGGNNSVILGFTHGGMSTDRQPKNKFINTLVHNNISPQPSITPSVGRMSKSVTGGGILSESTIIGGGSSTMIEREKRALEKIKLRQKKDIEQMMEYEMQMQRIQQKNEEKLIKQQQREEHRRQQLMLQHQMQEERKRQEEERKREKAELEAIEQKKRAEEQYRKEQEFAAKQRELDHIRKIEAQQREEERRRKQEEFQQQTERILLEQAQEVAKRKMEMERRDQERREFQAKIQVERQRAATQKRIATQAKIEQTKNAAEIALYKQRQQFEQRERQAEEKRMQFESARERERRELQQKSLAKSLELQKVMQQNQLMAEERKEQILRQQRILEQRQAELAKQKERELEEKRRYLLEKERHSVEVRVHMEKINSERINHIKSKAQQREESMSKTMSNREWQLMIKREQELLKREEKWQNVERIARAQEYKKSVILEKIEYDNMKTQNLMTEKERLFASRASIRREADRQKQAIMEQFEKMRKRGKIDRSALAQFGIPLHGESISQPIREDPDNETVDGGAENYSPRVGNNPQNNNGSGAQGASKQSHYEQHEQDYDDNQ